MAKAFTKQVAEIADQASSLQNSKRVSKSDATSQAVASNQLEKLGVSTPKTVREFYAKELKESAVQVASSMVERFTAINPGVYSYTFDQASEKTNGFSLFFTSSEENYKEVLTIGEKTIYLKAIDPVTPDAVLRSFESCKMFFEASRIERTKEQRAKEKFNETIRLAAAALGVSVDDLLQMRK